MRRTLAAAALAVALAAVAAAPASAQDSSLWKVYDSALKGARYVDLTHTITPSIPVWAGFGPSQFGPSLNPATGNPYTYKADGFEATRYTLATDQLGTQLDPPAHWAPEYASIDELPATFAVRPLVVISIVPQVRKNFNYSLTVSDIRKWEIDHGTIPAGSVVFVRSDWSKRWPSPELPKLKKFPGVSLKALEFLHQQRHILFHGHEPLDTDSSPTLVGESWLMHHGYAQAEGVANLDKVPATGCLVDIGYPKFGGGVGGYARFVAICPPGSAHGVRIGQVPEAPLRKYSSPLHWNAANTMRVRFAPSPTGQLHIGGARTALYNWLVARGQGGTMVLRIEDTDRERSTPENVEQILDALRWLEIDYDEGPISQVARSDRHQEVLQRLIDSGHAYRSTATADDVKEFKARYGADRGFRGEAQADGAVRLRVPDEGESVVHDLIRGDTAFQHVHMDDPVIARADGSVLYNFAVAVDDLDSEITHVIRGEDHLSNTPKQLLVLEAVGAEPPVYAHLPLLHGPDGKKLSKRHGAASVQELRERGYLPEAVRNYIALLGWGDADDETLISTDELVKRFRIERVSRNPAQFDEQKLRWMNGRYMRELGTEEITRRLEELTGRSGLHDAVAISEEKIQTLADFWPLAGFIFDGPADDPAAREKWLSDGGREALADARTALESAEPFDSEHIEQALRGVVEHRGVKAKDVFQPVRVALAGTTVSPGIFETLEVLGRDEALARIDAALRT